MTFEVNFQPGTTNDVDDFEYKLIQCIDSCLTHSNHQPRLGSKLFKFVDTWLWLHYGNVVFVM